MFYKNNIYTKFSICSVASRMIFEKKKQVSFFVKKYQDNWSDMILCKNSDLRVLHLYEIFDMLFGH